MNDHNLRTSTIVVNKNDEQVADTLEFLTSLEDVAQVEVIVVDASQGRLDYLRQRFPKIRWFDYVQPHGKRRTIAEQRNLGVCSARGDLIVFLDAGCCPAQDWLQELVRPIATEGEDIVFGAVTSKFRSTLHGQDVSYASSGGGYLSECSTTNIAIRREVFDRVGYFDESIGFAEDVDFTWRAIDAGFKLCYAPSATVAHNWGTTSEDMWRAFRYGVGSLRLYRKHRSRLKNLLGVDFYAMAYALYVLFLPVAMAFPAYLLLLAIPLVRNMKRHPFTTVAYHLFYGAGMLSEFFHVPVLKGQRRAPSHAG